MRAEGLDGFQFERLKTVKFKDRRLGVSAFKESTLNPKPETLHTSRFCVASRLMQLDVALAETAEHVCHENECSGMLWRLGFESSGLTTYKPFNMVS